MFVIKNLVHPSSYALFMVMKMASQTMLTMTPVYYHPLLWGLGKRKKKLT